MKKTLIYLVDENSINQEEALVCFKKLIKRAELKSFASLTEAYSYSKKGLVSPSIVLLTYELLKTTRKEDVTSFKSVYPTAKIILVALHFNAEYWEDLKYGFPLDDLIILPLTPYKLIHSLVRLDFI